VPGGAENGKWAVGVLIKFSKTGNDGCWHKQVMWLKKVRMGYVSRSHDLPKKENCDGLHKQLKIFLEWYFPKRKFWWLYKQVTWLKKVIVHYVSRSCDFQKRKNLMAYISNSKMLLAKITKKGNFLKGKLYARKFGKMPEKS
jgi:hypothetical protein